MIDPFANFRTFQVKFFRRLLLDVALHSIQSGLVAVLVLPEHIIEERDIRDG